MFTLPLALGGLGVESLLRHRSLLGASVLIIVYVTVRSWEPWCYELVTSLFAVGSLGVKSFLRYRSLFHLAPPGILGGPFGFVVPSSAQPVYCCALCLAVHHSRLSELSAAWPSKGAARADVCCGLIATTYAFASRLERGASTSAQLTPISNFGWRPFLNLVRVVMPLGSGLKPRVSASLYA